MERKTRAVLDPVYGEANFPMAVDKRAKRKVQQRDMRGSSFATAVTTIPEPTKIKMEVEVEQKQKRNHASINWNYVDHSSTNPTWKRFLKANELCIGCLEKGHISKVCEKRMSCYICHKNAPHHFAHKPKEEAEGMLRSHSHFTGINV